MTGRKYTCPDCQHVVFHLCPPSPHRPPATVPLDVDADLPEWMRELLHTTTRDGEEE